MKNLLEISLLVGLILGPLLLAHRSPTEIVRLIVGISVGYFVLALFILPRVPG